MATNASPKPHLVDKVSATLANSLLACPLRVALSRNPRFRDVPVRPKPEAILGTASHALIEAVSRGDFDLVEQKDVQAELGTYWDATVARLLEQAEQRGLLGTPPPVRRWPFFEAKRSDALDFAAHRLVSRGQADEPQGGFVAELKMESADPPLRGQIDRIERVGDEVRIIDLKTSLPPPNGELPEPHLVQLELYAALLRAATQDVPTKIGVQYFDGRRVVRDVDWVQVDALVEKVIAVRDEVNQFLQAGPEVDVGPLSRPDPDTCIHCDFQPVCEPFHQDVALRLPPYAANVVGTVVERVDMPGGCQLTIEDHRDEAAGGALTVVSGVPDSLAPDIGDTVSICWAVRNPRTHELRVNWLSVIYRWSTS